MLESLVVPGSCVSLVERWGLVVGALPGGVALRSPGVGFSFAEVDGLSDRVAAGLLRELGDTDREAPVGLCVGHSAEALVGLWGVLKAGRVVVVLDPHLPAARLRQIAELAGVVVCVADANRAGVAEGLGGLVSRVVGLSALLAGPVPVGAEREALVVAGRSRGGGDAAAIVFTSGSTGLPKGVIQTHEQILNEAYANREAFQLVPEDRMALVMPYGFAAGLYLIFIGLLNGASVWSYDPRDGGIRGLTDWIRDNRLTTFISSPHLARSLTGALGPDEVLESLRFLCTVGEAVHGRDVVSFRPHLRSDASFFNWTGSSEIGTMSLHEIPGGGAVPEGTVPAGRVVANKEVRLVGAGGGPVEPGEPGEIVAVSAFLSGGYWRDDAGNAARFGVEPDGRRTIRQGDLGRFDGDGNLVLLGRADAAVKVRGYLVEPSEIEAACLTADGVKEVVVITVADPPAPTRLIAYVVPDPGLRTASTAALRRHLRERLPEYMVPTTIMLLPELPRNERGKVDRPQLPPVPKPTRSAAPTTQHELVMADLWADVLGLDYIGVDDDFMGLGGDSLSAEELLAVVQERFGVRLASTDLIEAPTLAEFTRRVVLDSASLPSHPDVITLQAAGTLTPLFCFAGAGALALTFLPLSRHFLDRPVYAFQAHGLERRGFPDWSVAANARRYLEIIRIIQPHGPYLLLGHSFGGLVALRIAGLLTAAGERVDFVGLLDTYQPRSSEEMPTMEFEPMPDRPTPPSWIRPVTAFTQRQFHRVLPHGLPALRQWNRQARAYLAGPVRFDGQRHFDAFFDRGAITGRRSPLNPYPGNTLVVLADNNPDGPDAWEPLLTGPHTYTTIAAEHSSLLREPHATQLAHTIEHAIAADTGKIDTGRPTLAMNPANAAERDTSGTQTSLPAEV